MTKSKDILDFLEEKNVSLRYVKCFGGSYPGGEGYWFVDGTKDESRTAREAVIKEMRRDKKWRKLVDE